MKLTVVGCGDAWGSNGSGHSCFRLDAEGRVLVVDFGASAIVAWHRLGFSTDEIDAVFVSHLHGDHFGGLPFALLNAQYETRRKKPLLIAGPPGIEERLIGALDVFYPGLRARGWRFPLKVEELEPGATMRALDAKVTSVPVLHGGLVDGSALRVEAGGKIFAYSGDTEWTDALIEVSANADLFVVECFSASREIVGHLNWPRLKSHLQDFSARRIAVTHMGPAMRARAGDVRQTGLTVLDDGMVIEF